MDKELTSQSDNNTLDEATQKSCSILMMATSNLIDQLKKDRDLISASKVPKYKSMSNNADLSYFESQIDSIEEEIKEYKHFGKSVFFSVKI